MIRPRLLPHSLLPFHPLSFRPSPSGYRLRSVEIVLDGLYAALVDVLLTPPTTSSLATPLASYFRHFLQLALT